MDPRNWLQDELLDELKETARKQVTMTIEQTRKITHLGDSICQGEVLQALVKRSRDQVLTVMSRDAHSKWYYAAVALITHYSLLTTNYSLLTTNYSLLTTHYSLMQACDRQLVCRFATTHYSLHTTHYSLLTTHYSLLTTHYSLLSTQLPTS